MSCICTGKEFHAAGPANETPFTEVQTSRWHLITSARAERNRERDAMSDIGKT